MTLVEVLVVIAIIVLLAGLLLPGFGHDKSRAQRINCVSNLKQIGLSFRMWSNDHGDKFPWQVSTATNGTLEFAESPEVLRHFLAISNELSSPKVLACSDDSKRRKATLFSELSNANLSYFVGIDSSEDLPQSILSGDRNITGGVVASNGLMRFDVNSPAGWGNDIHKAQGNIGLGDGSAQQVTPNSLRMQIRSALVTETKPASLRLAIPK